MDKDTIKHFDDITLQTILLRIDEEIETGHNWPEAMDQRQIVVEEMARRAEINNLLLNKK